MYLYPYAFERHKAICQLDHLNTLTQLERVGAISISQTCAAFCLNFCCVRTWARSRTRAFIVMRRLNITWSAAVGRRRTNYLSMKIYDGRICCGFGSTWLQVYYSRVCKTMTALKSREKSFSRQKPYSTFELSHKTPDNCG